MDFLVADIFVLNLLRTDLAVMKMKSLMDYWYASISTLIYKMH